MIHIDRNSFNQTIPTYRTLFINPPTTPMTSPNLVQETHIEKIMEETIPKETELLNNKILSLTNELLLLKERKVLLETLLDTLHKK